MRKAWIALEPTGQVGIVRKTMKAHRLVLAAAFAVLLSAGCSPLAPGVEDWEAITKMSNHVFVDCLYQEGLFGYQSRTYANETVRSPYGGTVRINGSYVYGYESYGAAGYYRTFDFPGLTFEFSDWVCDEGKETTIVSGRMTLSGGFSQVSGDKVLADSDGNTLYGNLRLKGLYTGPADFDLSCLDRSLYSGTVDTDIGLWGFDIQSIHLDYGAVER